MENLRFSVPEILSLLGAAQCVYLVVYMLFRSGSLKSVFLPALYFLVLGVAFAADFGRSSVAWLIPGFDLWHWALWFMGPPLSVLLILQILQLPNRPPLKSFWVLALVPGAFLISQIIAHLDGSCRLSQICPVVTDWLVVLGLIPGLLSLIAIWFQRDRLLNLRNEKAGRDRYWLILTMIFMNLSFLAVMLVSLTPAFTWEQITWVRTFIGLGAIYIAGTSLFRIYPQAVLLIQRGERRAELSAVDNELGEKIRELLDVQKIYQEPDASRATLARELNVPEGALSRVINIQYGKSVPQLLNERRVEDAKRLLAETDAAIKIIAENVGFSSLASFNRVFKETSGESPSAYRTSHTINNTKNK